MKYRLQDLIDMEQFQSLQDRLNEIYSFPSAIIDNDGVILTATAWQDFCTKFHRVNKDSEKECILSDQYIRDHIHEANPAVSYRCPHGLVDNAAPIIINGEHLGNFFTGQFLLDKPDMDFFKAQAKKYGFDEDAYLAAVEKVPVWNQEQLNDYLFFIKGLIEVISAIGLKNLKAMESNQKLAESEKQFQAMFELASIGMAQSDPDTGRFLRVNQKMCEITGYIAGELLDLRVPDITHLEDRGADNELLQSVIHGEVPSYQVEMRYIRKDGEIVWVNVNMTLIRDDTGRPFRTMAAIEDITGRKQAEAALRESERRYRNLFQCASDGIFILSLSGELISVNESFARMHGYSIDELSRMKLRDLDTPAEHLNFPARLKRLMDEKSMIFEVEHYHKDGHVFPLEVSASLIDSDGESVILCFHRDITEREKAEEEKARLVDQLQQAQKMESVGRLAGGVAHDFNNMLNVILGHVDLAIEQVTPDQPLHDSLTEIQIAAERSADLTRQLLAFARKQIITPKILDLNVTVENILNMLRRLICEEMDLVWKPGSGLGQVKMDSSQIDQILANLCVNARDAITGPGAIIIETGNIAFDKTYCDDHSGYIPGDYTWISVSDDGCGMDKETLSLIFEPFFTTKDTGKGTGLGLATVYGVVKQNNGFINVISEPGSGTTFTIYLPWYENPAVQPGVESLKTPVARGDETILYVEDESAVMRLGKMLLERLGYNVLAVSTPSEALGLAGEHAGRIHLLMTDVIMPEMNGHDLAKRLLSLYPNLKILFVSGYTADIIAHHGVLDEKIHFIQKPFTSASLAPKLREALNG